MTPYDPRRQQRPATPPQWQPPQPPYVPRPLQQPWEPPRRKSWVRRHKAVTALLSAGALAVALIAFAVAASLGSRTASAGSAPQAGVAAAPAPVTCRSHHAVTDREWLQIVKDPAAAKGECIVVYGHVTQFDAVTGDSAFRAQAGGVNVAAVYGFANYPTNTLFEGDAKTLGALVQGDLFTAQVTVEGAKSYETTLGGSTTAPLLRVDSVKQTGHLGS